MYNSSIKIKYLSFLGHKYYFIFLISNDIAERNKVQFNLPLFKQRKSITYREFASFDVPISFYHLYALDKNISP